MILDAARALRSELRPGNSARLASVILQAHSPRAGALLDQTAEPLRLAARAAPPRSTASVGDVTVAIGR